MGHCISENGIEVDSEKVEAIKSFPVPHNVTALKSFLGMVNFIAKFLPNLSNILYPLHNLLKKDVQWCWSEAQSSAFEKIKQLITECTKLAIFDENKPITVENDASEYDLGAVLLQENKPIAFASRSLTETEKNYAQIEKELLAIVFGLHKFHNYVYGRDITVVTDHSSLTYLVKKPLSKAPKRLRNLMLKVQDYNFELIYVPGTKIPIADCLSRNPIKSCTYNIECQYISNIKDSDGFMDNLELIRNESKKDSSLMKLQEAIRNGFPSSKNDCDPMIKHFF